MKDELTPRMAEAMRYLGEGKRQVDMAALMQISPGAVGTLVARAVQRIGAETPEHAIKLLCERGFFKNSQG